MNILREVEFYALSKKIMPPVHSCVLCNECIYERIRKMPLGRKSIASEYYCRRFLPLIIMTNGAIAKTIEVGYVLFGGHYSILYFILHEVYGLKKQEYEL